MYTPQPQIAEIMSWCLQKVRSVPYNVTLRWVFYQAYQASKSGTVPWNLAGGKHDYARFKGWSSRVRKEFWNGWTPATLVDDQRELYKSGWGYADAAAWIASFKDQTCTLDKRTTQKQIVLICFEAAAMHSQFEHITSGYYVSLAPFRGDASIEYKWRIAKWIELLDYNYKKPVKILYFGDLDPKGAEIPENALRDIRKWCKVPFLYEHIGLKQEHVQRWDLPENPDKHGYQWEALNDDQARELIHGALDRHIDLSEIQKVLQKEDEATEIWKEFLDDVQVD